MLCGLAAVLAGAAGKTVHGHARLGAERAEEFMGKFSFLPSVEFKLNRLNLNRLNLNSMNHRR